jgi:hypothetical protein
VLVAMFGAYREPAVEHAAEREAEAVAA